MGKFGQPTDAPGIFQILFESDPTRNFYALRVFVLSGTSSANGSDRDMNGLVNSAFFHAFEINALTVIRA